MPSLLLNKSDALREDLITKMTELESEYQEGDLTAKGYCKRKWKLLEPFVETSFCKQVSLLQSRLENAKLSETDYVKEMMKLLNIELDEQPKDCSSESLIIDDTEMKLEDETETSRTTLQNSIELKTPFIILQRCDGKIPTGFRRSTHIEEMESDPEGSGNVKKKRKKNNHHFLESEIIRSSKQMKKVSHPQPAKCRECHQLLNSPDTILYAGHPNGSVEELIALTDPKLSLFTGDENFVSEQDERPQHKITHFSVYDKEGHLCSFDSGLIERNVLLFFSGYIKPIYEESPEPEDGVAAHDIGPIDEWWLSGYDGGEKALIGFSTPSAEYYLMQPSPYYQPIFDTVNEKIYMGKLVIDFLLDNDNSCYEDLINMLQTTVPPPGLSLSEDSLLRHAQFICDQVSSFDEASDTQFEDEGLITTNCMRDLMQLAGVTLGQRRAMRRAEQKEVKQKNKDSTKATTTDLVRGVFESMFEHQLDANSTTVKVKERRLRCGVCKACQQPDCGTCVSCADMVKFGGSGSSKQSCVNRRCSNKAVQEADDDNSDAEDTAPAPTVQRTIKKSTSRVKKSATWLGEAAHHAKKKTFYEKVLVADQEIARGDAVLIDSNEPGVPMPVGIVMYMWHDIVSKEQMFHAQWFCRGIDTVLGETSDSQELFLLYECGDVPISSISEKITVHKIEPPSDWNEFCGSSFSKLLADTDKYDEKTFYYKMRYNAAYCRFETLEMEPSCNDKENHYRFCKSCEKRLNEEKSKTPYVEEELDSHLSTKQAQYGVVRWLDEEYRVGSSVYLKPGTFKFKNQLNFSQQKKDISIDQVDENIYPELYRKTSYHVKGCNDATPQPFNIGIITAIMAKKDGTDIVITVNKMYRPENTHMGSNHAHQADLNLLYWSDEKINVDFTQVTGKCYVCYKKNLDCSEDEWTQRGPHRFYFNKYYDRSKQTFNDLPSSAMIIGSKGNGNGNKYKVKRSEKIGDSAKPWPDISRPLQCLDIFAGCGGLSEGLHQAGIANTCWAIEKDEAAANAFQLNNPKTVVLTDDCNDILKMVMNGQTKSSKGQSLPLKGKVELLCGGPPCQGFSGMNRFNSRQNSLLKNSLVVSYLSFCDYYRPRFFILENVRNFVSFNRSMVLKLSLRCLVRMGYQCTFGVLQAGNFGVPQTRRRAIILAAAPGEILPNFPEPTHSFCPKTTQLTVKVDNKTYVSNCRWVESAPRRTITVRDAMSDLPEIGNGANELVISYNSVPQSHFQRLIRGDQYQQVLTDHICKEMSPLVVARIALIPTKPGSDWRDLPNIEVKLSNGSMTKKLQYLHEDKKHGKSSTGALRGVCACASGKLCDPVDRQFNTLIPWCLPHSSNRHNNWAGLYGRLNWDGFFSTTITNPEPMGKQGRVLHPQETRVVSVRECARSQGFPDTYRFYGTVLDKHCQVGNAVPPPMGAAIGYEIRKCLALAESAAASTQMDISPAT